RSTAHSRTGAGDSAVRCYVYLNGDDARLLSVIFDPGRYFPTPIGDRERHIPVSRASFTILGRQRITQVTSLVARHVTGAVTPSSRVVLRSFIQCVGVHRRLALFLFYRRLFRICFFGFVSYYGRGVLHVLGGHTPFGDLL